MIPDKLCTISEVSQARGAPSETREMVRRQNNGWSLGVRKLDSDHVCLRLLKKESRNLRGVSWRGRFVPACIPVE